MLRGFISFLIAPKMIADAALQGDGGRVIHRL